MEVKNRIRRKEIIQPTPEEQNMGGTEIKEFGTVTHKRKMLISSGVNIDTENRTLLVNQKPNLEVVVKRIPENSRQCLIFLVKKISQKLPFSV